MTTKNPRLNVVLDPVLMGSITRIAKKEGVSRSLVARDLIKDAIAMHEDMHWQKIASKREKSFVKSKAISHKDVWKS